MTKTNSLKVTNKLPFWLAVWAVIIIAGLAILLIPGLRFNMAANVSDNHSLTVRYDALPTLNDDLEQELRDICLDAFEENKVNYIDYDIRETSAGGEMEFKVATDVSDDALKTVGESVKTALAASETLKTVVCSYEISYNETYLPYNYIGRAVLSASIILLVAAVYVFIRYNLSMGLATLIAGFGDVLVMLGLTLIFRVPVTSSLAVAAILAALYSVLCSLVKFSGMRPLMKSEEYADFTPTEAVENSNARTVKSLLILGGISLVFFLALGAVAFLMSGITVLSFAISGALAVLASMFSSNLLSPALVAVFKEKGKKIKEKRLAKRQAEKQEEERLKAEKRDRKKD